MRNLEQINLALRRLDLGRRNGDISRDQFRARRRDLLLSMDERNITTAPGFLHAPSADPLEALSAAEARAVPKAAEPARSRRGTLAAVTVAVLLGLAAGAAWLIWNGARKPAAQSPASPTTAASVGMNADAAPALAIAARLSSSNWTTADLEAFAADWTRLPAEQQLAVRDDAAVWLLRSEINRRLGELREVQAVDPQAENLGSIDQLTTLRDLLRIE